MTLSSFVRGQQIVELNGSMMYQEQYTFKTDTHYLIPANITISILHSTITIEPGVVISIGKGSYLKFSNSSVYALGTVNPNASPTSLLPLL